MLHRILLSIGLSLVATQTMSAAAVKTLKCEMVSISITAEGQTLKMGRSELQEFFNSLPKNCRKTGFSYGNGIIDDIPLTKRCARAFSKTSGSLNRHSVGYPMKYTLNDSAMAWVYKGEIKDPSFGEAKIIAKSSLDLETMVMAEKLQIESDGEEGVVSMTSICEDA